MGYPQQPAGTQLDSEELAAHSAQVRRVAERVRAARDAAVEVSLSSWRPDMYGALLGQLARVTSWAQTKTVDDLIGTAADLVDACADGVADERQNYEELDEEIAELMGRILRDGNHRRRDESGRVVDDSLEGSGLERPDIPSPPRQYPYDTSEAGR